MVPIRFRSRFRNNVNRISVVPLVPIRFRSRFRNNVNRISVVPLVPLSGSDNLSCLPPLNDKRANEVLFNLIGPLTMLKP
jgi:hypothetical protein